MIEIRQLSKRFGKLGVLEDVNLSFNEGECIALIGPNGCGKTTLIKCMLGMVIPGKGDILFKGKSVRNKYRFREEIGYMPQIGRYPDNMTIGQIFETMKDIRKFDGEIDEELMYQFKLPEIFDKRMRTLSGGTTQKVSASLAFLFNPRILILDEPTAGLDPLASEILKNKIISEKNKGKLILITSHLLSELDELITQIIYMQEGKVHFHDTVESLLLNTGEQKISKAIARILQSKNQEPKTSLPSRGNHTP